MERVCRMVLDRNPEELYGQAYTEARKHVGKRIDARLASFDLSFSDPKSVSLLAAGSSRRCGRKSKPPAMRPSEPCWAGWNRRRSGSAGATTASTGSAAAASPPPPSITGPAAKATPKWHTHVLVQNATVGPDSRWSALDSRKLYAHAMTADRLYHAALRAELTRRLDVRWRPVDQRSEAAEIEGLHDRNLLRAFSTRRAQVLAQQQE